MPAFLLRAFTLLLALLLCAVLLFLGYGMFAGPLLRVADNRHLELQDVVSELAPNQIILVGESHNNPLHHSQQLELIRELHEKAERPMAIGLEMFEASSQQVLDAWVANNISTSQFITAYYKNWGEDWQLYADIFLYAREHQIPLIGLNAPRRVAQKVGQKGFAALDQQDLAQLPGQITCDVDGAYEEFIAQVYDWHGGRNFSFRTFCEAQMLWDTVMAANIVNYAAQQPEQTIVVLAGDGHCWKPAIPRQLKRRSNLPHTVILPETRKHTRFSVKEEETDYLWLYDFLSGPAKT